jgi:phosphomannomutase/phosphoglucomutase
MAFKKKAPITQDTASAEARPEAGGKGKTLSGYFLPLLLVAALVLAAVAGLAHQTLATERKIMAERAAAEAARLLAAQLAGQVRAAGELLRLMADEAAQAATATSDWQELGERFSTRASGFLQIRVLPAGWDVPDPSGDAPLGYAGVDLARRVQAGARVPAEVHQLQTPRPYLAVVEPISGATEPRGVLFGALSLQPARALLDGYPDELGALWLTQTVGGEVVPLSDMAAGATAAGRVPVEGTTIEVAYRGPQIILFDTSLLVLAGVVGFGLLLLAMAALLQARRLGADLRVDMGSAVTLGEAILARQPAARPETRVRPSADALALLAQYAQRSRSGNGRNGDGVGPSGGTRTPVPAPFPHQPVDEAMVVEEVDQLPEAPKTGAGPASRGLPAHVFRAYDIRGLAEKDFPEDAVRLLGRAVGTLVRERGGEQVAVARDVRISSRDLASSLIEGLVAAGCEVIDLGLAPTPLLYFSRYSLEIDGAVMVTGSHNPPEYNGFKIVVGDEVLAGSDLRELGERMTHSALASDGGVVRKQDLRAAYLEYIQGDVALGRSFKLVIDAGNGVAGELAVALFENLGCEVVPLFCQPDGRFPNHHPDPGKPENLEALIEEVQASGADLGIAFDGDGDRLGVVDEQGAPVAPDHILMLLAADVLIRHPGVDILYDVKGSRHLAGYILANGGRPIMWRSGHARMRAKLQQTAGLLAGEYSGHYFIKERWFGFDDAIYAAARMLEALSADPREPSEVFAELPASSATPELHLALPEGRNVELMGQLAGQMQFDDAKIIDLDGLRVEFTDGWGLVRASNTEPALTFRFEGDTPEAVGRIQGEFKKWLLEADASLKLPF